MSRYYDDDDDYRGRRSPSRSHHGRRDEVADPAYMTSAGDYYPSASNPDFGRDDDNMAVATSHRTRSMPPDRAMVARRDSSLSPSRGALELAHRERSTKHNNNNPFSTSTSGIGVGVIGAIVGGLAAREASEAATRGRDRRHHSEHGHNRTALISTIVGAAVGGLGANAIENHFEQKRHDKKRREAEDNRDLDEDEYYSDDSRDDWDRRSRSRRHSPSPSRSRTRSRSRSRASRASRSSRRGDDY